MATIYEVAELAGVSPATVSRVFNGTRVSPEREEAVREAAEKLNFTPNRTARTLRRRNSEVIALVIPDIENPYFTELARGVEDVAQAAGYSVVLCNTDERPDKEQRYLAVAVSENMAGVILAPASDQTDLDAFVASGRPVVAVDRASAYDIDAVVVSNRDAGRAAASALLEAGYRRIACITGPDGIETALERAAGWREVVGERMPEGYLRYSTFRVEGGREAMTELLALPEPPDAVVATNNLMAVGALQLLAERGLTPPEVGVGVVGGLPFTTISPAAVSVVRLPARHIGVTAARMLMERIGGDREPARTVVLRSELIPAAAPAPAAAAPAATE
ncbi:LacI family DNA-binding transcriptional regulator [Agromyces archimandritae]|uniref:LacI family DNA-binding transcriptional regulator n=1 Tax=Agromyces archimandritae TaxID=2781962 RepID=A0A975IMF7_9MICO|nr:LacI family DNA-binding transcriptional regulator [Agromyces archimandritae]QTX03395.1 LacI family DNA-binding transcriptional regulator [Agromyces archimandritae]